MTINPPPATNGVSKIDSFVVQLCTVISAECLFLTPQLTGKTMLTKLQIGVIVLGAVGVAANTVKALRTPTLIENGNGHH